MPLSQKELNKLNVENLQNCLAIVGYSKDDARKIYPDNSKASKSAWQAALFVSMEDAVKFTTQASVNNLWNIYKGNKYKILPGDVEKALDQCNWRLSNDIYDALNVVDTANPGGDTNLVGASDDSGIFDS